MQIRKPFVVAIGGKATVIRVWWPFHYFASATVRFILERVRRMKQKPVENNCPVMVETADGIPARCMFYMVDGKTCPRHGDVSEIQKP